MLSQVTTCQRADGAQRPIASLRLSRRLSGPFITHKPGNGLWKTAVGYVDKTVNKPGGARSRTSSFGCCLVDKKGVHKVANMCHIGAPGLAGRRPFRNPWTPSMEADL